LYVRSFGEEAEGMKRGKRGQGAGFLDFSVKRKQRNKQRRTPTG